jgi:hypothetical protein
MTGGAKQVPVRVPDARDPRLEGRFAGRQIYELARGHQ